MSPELKAALKGLSDEATRPQSEQFFATADRAIRAELEIEARERSKQICGPKLFTLLVEALVLLGFSLLADHLLLKTQLLTPARLLNVGATVLVVDLFTVWYALPWATRCRRAVDLCGGPLAVSFSLELLDRLRPRWLIWSWRSPEKIRGELIENIDRNMGQLSNRPGEVSMPAQYVLRKWASAKPGSLAPWQEELLGKFTWLAR